MSFGKEQFVDVEFAPELVHGLRKLWKDKQFCDIIVTAEGREFHCQRNILTASSKYFASQLTQNFTKKITLPSRVGARSFEALIKYFYSGTLVYSSQSVEGIFKAADFLGLSKVVDVCSDIMQRTIDELNCVRRFCFSDDYDISSLPARRLREAAGHFIIDKALEVSKTDGFLDLSGELIDKIFHMDVQPKQADRLFLLAVKWVSHDEVHRLRCLLDLLQSIPVDGFSIDFVKSTILANKLLRKNTRSTAWVIDKVIPNFLASSGVVSKKLDNSFSSPQGSPSALFVANWLDIPKCYKLDLESLRLKSVADRPAISSFTAISNREHIYLLCGCEKGDSYRLDKSQNSAWMNPEIDLDFKCLAAGCVILGDELYAVGGYDIQTFHPLSSCSVFNFQTGQRRALADMKIKRPRPGIGVYANSIYAAGGLGTGLKVERFDPRIGEWQEAGNFSWKIGPCAATTIGNDFYCCDIVEGHVQQFDFENNQSQPICSLKTGSYGNKYWITSTNEELYAARNGQILKYRSVADKWTSVCYVLNLQSPIIVPWN